MGERDTAATAAAVPRDAPTESQLGSSHDHSEDDVVNAEKQNTEEKAGGDNDATEKLSRSAAFLLVLSLSVRASSSLVTDARAPNANP